MHIVASVATGIVGAVVPDEAAIQSLLKSEVGEAFGHLSEREQEFLRLRFGLDDGKIRTPEKVGKEYGLSRERIGQIESKTLAKLRDYLEGLPDAPDDPDGGSRVREPRRPSPTSGSGFAELPKD